MRTPAVIGLLVLLAMLGVAPPFAPAALADVQVYFAPADFPRPAGRWATACFTQFHESPLCPEQSARVSRLIVLYPETLDAPHYRRMRNMLAHEARHLLYGADGPLGDRGNERATTLFACGYQWVPECYSWAALHGWR